MHMTTQTSTATHDSTAAMPHRPCPLCGNTTCRDIGPLLAPHAEFAGLPMEVRDEFRLLGCDRCGFRFRSPAIPDEVLMACYEASDADFGGWMVDPLQRQFDMMRDLLAAAAPGRRVLDVGCFHASFLEFLGPSWQRFGVEPSRSAAKVARDKGVTILADTLDTLPPDTEPFDAIVAMDLIEHLNDPAAFFRTLAPLLRDGGVLLLVSGDAEAPSWRFMGSLYWYCSLLEHCGFFTKRSLEFIGDRTGLALERYQRIAHLRTTARHKAYDLIKNMGYQVGRACRGFGAPRLRKLFVERCAPGWLSASDHFLAIMRKRTGVPQAGTIYREIPAAATATTRPGEGPGPA